MFDNQPLRELLHANFDDHRHPAENSQSLGHRGGYPLRDQSRPWGRPTNLGIAGRSGANRITLII
jgi:hypothetical protein